MTLSKKHQLQVDFQKLLGETINASSWTCRIHVTRVCSGNDENERPFGEVLFDRHTHVATAREIPSTLLGCPVRRYISGRKVKDKP